MKTDTNCCYWISKVHCLWAYVFEKYNEIGQPHFLRSHLLHCVFSRDNEICMPMWKVPTSYLDKYMCVPVVT